ncbi:Hypothetical protein FKW44_015054 [Caligus rogercresseyi]|uniref:Uncharacterized protein n=1 Tax=Caligus rogercresseyi TaxID=217165 RepID=A0A7T8GZW3_CALRO|nr:Hypothetical protein FKW44_015054 [Caligus rogercresseyi]
MNGVLPLPRLRQSKEFLPSSSLESSIPVPLLREWSPNPRRTSLESFPSLVFVIGSPSLVFDQGGPSFVFVRGRPPSLLFVNGVLPSYS